MEVTLGLLASQWSTQIVGRNADPDLESTFANEPRKSFQPLLGDNGFALKRVVEESSRNYIAKWFAILYCSHVVLVKLGTSDEAHRAFVRHKSGKPPCHRGKRRRPEIPSHSVIGPRLGKNRDEEIIHAVIGRGVRRFNL